MVTRSQSLLDLVATMRLGADEKPKPSRPSGGDDSDDETWNGDEKPKPKPNGGLDCLDLQDKFGKWISAFTEDCGVEESDVSLEGEGQVLDTKSICSETCRRHPLFQTSVPKLPESVEHCGERAEQLQLQEKLVNLMYASLQKCGDKPSNPGMNSSVPVKSVNEQCPSQALAHLDCGYMGISQLQCEEKRCCWNPNNKGLPYCHQSKQSDGGKWCYDDNGEKNRETCPNNFDRHKRTDCHAFLMLDQVLRSHKSDEVRGQACQDMGCCWQPLEHNSREPWCFHKVCA